MTSANRIEYTIFDKEGNTVGSHSQNVMCKRCNDGLDKFKPESNFTILAWGYDEEEELWEDDEAQSLEVWLKKNPAEFTFKPFEVGDIVKLTKKRGEAKVVEKLKGKFLPEYIVEIQNGDKLTIAQGEIIPTKQI
jgi:hypothetical protein